MRDAIKALVFAVTGEMPTRVGSQRWLFEGKRWQTWSLLRHIADVMEHG